MGICDAPYSYVSFVSAERPCSDSSNPALVSNEICIRKRDRRDVHSATGPYRSRGDGALRRRTPFREQFRQENKGISAGSWPSCNEPEEMIAGRQLKIR